MIKSTMIVPMMTVIAMIAAVTPVRAGDQAAYRSNEIQVMVLTTEFSVSQGRSTSMEVDEDEGFCFLTQVKGNMNKDDHYAKVYLKDSTWHIAASSSDDLYAYGRCIRFE